jgi:hypothetical protein
MLAGTASGAAVADAAVADAAVADAAVADAAAPGPAKPAAEASWREQVRRFAAEHFKNPAW